MKYWWDLFTLLAKILVSVSNNLISHWSKSPKPASLLTYHCHMKMHEQNDHHSQKNVHCGKYMQNQFRHVKHTCKNSALATKLPPSINVYSYIIYTLYTIYTIYTIRSSTHSQQVSIQSNKFTFMHIWCIKLGFFLHLIIRRFSWRFTIVLLKDIF